MATTNRKPLTFNVSQDTYNHFVSLFPHEKISGRPDCSESNLLALLDPYEHPVETNSDLLRQYNEQQHKAATLQEQNEKLATELKAAISEIESLKAQLDEQQQHHGNDLDEQVEANRQLSAQVDSLNEQIRLLNEQNATLQNQVSVLSNQEINWDKIRTTMQPFTVALLEETAARLTQKYGHEVTPMQILTDMFLRYTIDRWNEWFYKFVLKDADILAIAQSINPDIRTIEQIRKAVLKK